MEMRGLILMLAGILLAIGEGKTQKIFPNAVGYGTESRGAYAGSEQPKVLIVDTLYAGKIKTGENRGSFEWAISENYPRIIVFEVGGIIDYSYTNVRSMYLGGSYCSIYGQTAPSPGITLKSCALSIDGDTHDVLVQHIAIRYGAYPLPNGVVSPQDCMTLLRGSYNVVIDHCSLSWSVDEIIGAYTKNFTISNSLMYEGLEYNYHANEGGDFEPERHGLGPIAASPSQFTSYNNLYAWFTNRLPKLATDKIAFINNYTTGYALFGPDLSKASTGNNGVFIGNNFYPTPGITAEIAENFTFWRGGLDINSKICMIDNNCKGKDIGRSEIENIHADISDNDVQKIFTENPNDVPVDISTYSIIPADSVMSQIIQNSGFRPWDRDYYDSIALKKLIEGKQDYINSPYAMPARAYNRSIYEGLRTTAGNMKNGYNFSSDNVSFSVNGKNINLTQNTNSQKEVLELLNSLLPDGTEAVDHPHELSQHIIIQTSKTGSEQYVKIEGDASVFGIPNGTYHGQDAPYGNVIYPKVKRNLDLPSEPHGDNNNNGYTNIEEWVLTFVSDTERNSPIKTTEEVNDSIVKININAEYNLSGWNELYSGNSTINNLNYMSGNASTINFNMWKNWRASNGGETSGSCFDEGVIKTYVFTADDSIRYFKFSGLSENKAYTIEFLCSRSLAAPDERGAAFFHKTKSDSIDAKGNTCELVSFENLIPYENEISIGYRKRIGDFNGHVNAIILTEKKRLGNQFPVIRLKANPSY